MKHLEWLRARIAKRRLLPCPTGSLKCQIFFFAPRMGNAVMAASRILGIAVRRRAILFKGV
jgi:hypothetical protein